MATFSDVRQAMVGLAKPDGLPEVWLSPYRLLGGSAFAIATAERVLNGPDPDPVDIPNEWWQSLQDAATNTGTNPVWFDTWHASFMLTNAIFRVAAAAEKTCYLVGDLQEPSRKQLWKAVRDQDSTLCLRVPAARRALGQMPKSRPQREAWLTQSRAGLEQSQRLRYPYEVSLESNRPTTNCGRATACHPS